MKYVERVKKGHGYMIRVTEEGLSAVKKMSEFLYGIRFITRKCSF